MEDSFAKAHAHSRVGVSGMARLFSSSEIKAFFQRYISVIVLIEVGIFVACWLYQLGLVGEDRFGPVTRLFPWKTYFLLAFLAPVTLTFLLGLIVGAFNIFFYGDARPHPGADVQRDGGGARWMRSLLQIPFLFMLLLLGAAAGLIYRADEIFYFLDHAGAAVLDVFRVVGVLLVICGTAAGILWMILGYKLKKQALEYHYKAEVLRCLPLSGEREPAPDDVRSRALSDLSAVAPPATGRKRKAS